MTVVPFDPSKKKPKTNSEAKTKEAETKFRLEHRAIEERARKVVATFGVMCARLKELKPEVDAIREFFNAHPRGSVEVLGCSSFRDFCLKQLHRSEQAVYKMLRAGAGEEKGEKKRRSPKKPEPMGGPLDSKDKQQAAVLALNAVYRAEHSKTPQEKESAMAEYRQIAENGSVLRSSIAGDIPNPRVIIRDLIELLEQNAAMLAKIGLSGMLSDKDVEREANDCASRTMMQCKAMRKRFNIEAPAVN